MRTDGYRRRIFLRYICAIDNYGNSTSRARGSVKLARAFWSREFSLPHGHSRDVTRDIRAAKSISSGQSHFPPVAQTFAAILSKKVKSTVEAILSVASRESFSYLSLVTARTSADSLQRNWNVPFKSRYVAAGSPRTRPSSDERGGVTSLARKNQTAYFTTWA